MIAVLIWVGPHLWASVLSYIIGCILPVNVIRAANSSTLAGAGTWYDLFVEDRMLALHAFIFWSKSVFSGLWVRTPRANA